MNDLIIIKTVFLAASASYCVFLYKILSPALKRKSSVGHFSFEGLSRRLQQIEEDRQSRCLRMSRPLPEDEEIR